MEKPISELLEFSILNIDKPSGPTSFDISDFVRKKLNLRKTSHFGTLDPKVTGVLPIALNRACKLTGFFLGHDKEYVGIMRLHKDVELEKIKKIIKEKFLGKIKQTPPVRSSVKRQEREREIISFELLEKDGKDFLFKAKVQGGTYIRKLIDDLGKELGCGAHMLELRRISAGIFSEEDKSFVDLYKFDKIISEFNKINNKKSNKVDEQLNKVGLSDNKPGWASNFAREISLSNNEQGCELGGEEELRKILIPAEEALKKIFPVVQIKEDSVKRLLTGKPIMKEDIIEGNKIVSSIKIRDKKDNKLINNKYLSGSEAILRGGNSMSLGGAKINEGKFIAFCEDKFIGIYDKGKPLFVLQEMR